LNLKFLVYTNIKYTYIHSPQTFHDTRCSHENTQQNHGKCKLSWGFL